jgi:hypothetical protein
LILQQFHWLSVVVEGSNLIAKLFEIIPALSEQLQVRCIQVLPILMQENDHKVNM